MLFSISFRAALAWCVRPSLKLWKTQLNGTVCVDEFSTMFDGLVSDGRGIMGWNTWFVTFWKSALKEFILGGGETFVIDQFCVIFPIGVFSLSLVPTST